MAGKTKTTEKKNVKGYVITVKGRPDYNGIGAGGVQFAYGTATIAGGTIVNWFKEHEGYEVKEILEPEAETETDNSES